jgi:hypothetical protein
MKEGKQFTKRRGNNTVDVTITVPFTDEEVAAFYKVFNLVKLSEPTLTEQALLVRLTRKTVQRWIDEGRDEFTRKHAELFGAVMLDVVNGPNRIPYLTALGLEFVGDTIQRIQPPAPAPVNGSPTAEEQASAAVIAARTTP